MGRGVRVGGGSQLDVRYSSPHGHMKEGVLDDRRL